MTARRKSRPVRERIEEQSEPELNTGCRLWFGKVNNRKYGVVSWKNKRVAAHRASLLDSLGLSKTKMHVLHSCDTPLCVNPAHLRLGTNAENVEDARKRGRFLGVERRKRAKLSAEEIRKITEDYSSGMPASAVARTHNVSDTTVWYHAAKAGIYKPRKTK